MPRIAICLGLLAVAPAFAQTTPAVETFDAGAAGWLNGQFQPLDEIAAGGFEGSPFVQAAADLNADAGTGVTVFRALPGSSAGVFTGDYLAGGIGQLSLFVQHDAGEDVDFFVRFAGPANFPGAFFFAPAPVPSGVLTEVTFDLSVDSPLFGAEGAPPEWPAIFNSVFSNVGNIQVVATKPDGFSGPPTLFGLDQVEIAIPSPGVGVCLGLAGAAAVRRRRR